MKPHLKISKAAIILCNLFIAATSVFAQRGTAIPTYHNDKDNLDQSDVGGEYISVIGIRPLDEVIDELQPQFNLTPEEAYQQAVPDTLNSSQATSSSSRFTLQVGLMMALLNSASNATASSQSAVLNVFTNYPFALNIDPALQYKAAASLYENVELLNRSLKDIPHFRGYAPFVVTIQISLIPYRHDAPYDTYADVAFFTDTNEAPESPRRRSETVPLVFPMPTADALEMSNDQQTRNQLRQWDLTLAAASHGVGGQAGFGSAKAKNDTASGFDLNSLLTVGRLSQNCMEVRIGARNTAGSAEQFNMVPETHNVTFLVFAPTNSNELQMESHTVFRNFKNNELLNELADEKIEDQFLTNVLAYWFPDLTGKPINAFQRKLKQDPQFHELYHDFLFGNLVNTVFDANSIDNSTFTSFRQAFVNFFREAKVKCVLKKADVQADFFCNPFKNLNVNDIDSLWLDTVRITGLGDQYANDRIALPVSMPDFPETNLTVICTDDGQSSVLSISGGHRLESTKLHAILTCSNGFSLHSDLINVTNSGTTLNIYFPLLSALTNSAFTNSDAFNPTNLELELDDNGSILISNSYNHFACYIPKQQNSQTSPAWKIIRTYGALTAGITNDFGIVLATNSLVMADNYYLDVAGAIVLGVTNSFDGTLDESINGMYSLNVTNSLKEFVFVLKPLPAGQTVDFNLWNDKELVTNLNHQVVYASQSSK